jgi:L-threonylcarbamoyladenylate synthase
LRKTVTEILNLNKMQIKTDIWNDQNLVKILQADGVVVMPTDTIYGMVGRAQSKSVVNRIYKIRNRAGNKPCIILIGDISELDKFSIKLSEEQKKALMSYWSLDPAQDLRPEPTSIVLDCPNEKFSYLHRGTNTLAFRMPASQVLRDLLLKVGPLIAPSANTEKFPASENIEDAKKYFGETVDLYLDGGPVISRASKVIKLHKEGTLEILRD